MFHIRESVRVTMYKPDESSDEGAVKRRTDRCVELAGMFKEMSKGSMKQMYTLLAKFGLQEGVTERKANEYLKMLRHAGLIKITNGHKSWRYDEAAEWELFKVEI